MCVMVIIMLNKWFLMTNSACHSFIVITEDEMMITTNKQVYP